MSLAVCTLSWFCSQHNKAEVLSKLQEMTEQYKEWEEVVVEYTAEKERQRLREELEIRQRHAAVKVCECPCLQL